MEPRISVGVIGDFDPEFPPHSATNAALEHSAAALGAIVDVRWHATEDLVDADLDRVLVEDALWCAPGSPYRSLDGGLRVVGVDGDGEARVLELRDRRFFIATLFVPQLSSSPAAGSNTVAL
jgi:CTP synthase (UTP-ammonia lyase)